MPFQSLGLYINYRNKLYVIFCNVCIEDIMSAIIFFSFSNLHHHRNKIDEHIKGRSLESLEIKIKIHCQKKRYAKYTVFFITLFSRLLMWTYVIGVTLFLSMYYQFHFYFVSIMVKSCENYCMPFKENGEVVK